MRWAALFAAIVLSGCAAPTENAASSETAVLVHHERFSFEAGEAQLPTGGYGLGVNQDDCAGMDARGGNVTLRRVVVNVTWDAAAPSQRELHLEFADEEPEQERTFVDGPSPLTLEVRNVTLLDDQMAIAYLGAPRGTGLVVKQPFTLDLTVEYDGPLEVYPLSCTIAG